MTKTVLDAGFVCGFNSINLNLVKRSFPVLSLPLVQVKVRYKLSFLGYEGGKKSEITSIQVNFLSNTEIPIL